MATRVTTLMWGDAWRRYGHRFASTFWFWPGSVSLCLVTDRMRPVNGRQILLGDIPAWAAFQERWCGVPAAHGYDKGRGGKVDADGRSWRHDAMTWAPQAFAAEAGFDGLNDGDVFVWLDADVRTLKPVPDGWVESLLGEHDVAALLRRSQHPEIGFYAMRVGDGTREMMRRFAGAYADDSVFGLREWHSAYVWRHALEATGGLRVRSLTASGERRDRGHVWPYTPLADYTAHDKGKQKDRVA